MKSKVYFTRAISPEKVCEAYHKLGIDLPGRVAVKLHSGEQGNQNYLPPEFWKPMIDEIGGTVCETNTAYGDASEACATTRTRISSCWRSTAGRSTSPWT